MKRFIILAALLIIGCSSNRSDWTSGGESNASYQEQQYNEQTETMRKQVPEARPNF